MVAASAGLDPAGGRHRGDRGPLGRRPRASRAGLGLNPVGQVRVDGEIWSARSAEPIDPGDVVTVTAVDGLVLEVEPARRE